jgi:hypothetical protein
VYSVTFFGHRQFHFFGSGDADYFEWLRLLVVFREEPTKKQKHFVKALLPPSLNGIVTFEERCVRIFVGEWGGTFFRKFPPSEVNKDIVTWLNLSHRMCPILFAYRPEDTEAKGTAFDDWHYWSERRRPEIESVISEFGDRRLPEELDAMAERARLWRDYDNYSPPKESKLLDMGDVVRVIGGLARGKRGTISFIGINEDSKEPVLGLRAENDEFFWANLRHVERLA